MTSEHWVSSCHDHILLHNIQPLGRHGWGLPAPELMVIYICRHTLSEWDNDSRSEAASSRDAAMWSHICMYLVSCIFVLVRMQTSQGHFTADPGPRLPEKCDLGDYWLNHHISHNTATAMAHNTSLKYWNSQNIDEFINQFVVGNSHTSVFL